MKARYSKRAIHDLISAADYMRDRNPRAVLAIEQRIRSAIRQFELFPFIGRTTDDRKSAFCQSCTILIWSFTRFYRTRSSSTTFGMGVVLHQDPSIHSPEKSKKGPPWHAAPSFVRVQPALPSASPRRR